MTGLNNEIDSKLEKLLKETFEIDKISLNFSMDDIPEWDSFKHIELIIAIEKEFKIKLEYTDTTEMVSIPIIKSKILKLLNDK
ncbi:uncharacterized protein METZ01_LOCUS363224 [marine metagenome]|jgi:acyl carrier protein|uniref:Carrier domain-containing protein n=1 Tax=marine metagenome TaxID=408172 RepID=A0A382SK74_9ZZZZ|tara:strand:+ start:120 stop:368 length:249 start_codon:yes stop_codon:yes gene_type:complete